MIREEFKEKMKKVAELLGYEIEFNDSFLWCYMSYLKKDNAKILAYYLEAKNKIIIESSYPKTITGEYVATSKEFIRISLSPQKSAEKIAIEIKNRFLSIYEDKLKEIMERIEKANSYHKEKIESIKKIAEHFGWEIYHGIIFPRMKNVHSIESYTNKEVKFEVICEPEIAIKVLEILKKGGEQ